MKKTTALVFDHRGRTKDGQKGPIEVRLTMGRQSFYFGTGIKVHRSEFVAGKIVNCPGADRLNERIIIVYDKINQMVNESIASGTEIDTEAMRRKVWAVAQASSDERPLLTWIGEQIPLLNIGEGTRKHYYPLLDRLTQFGEMVRWEDLTVENIVKFDAWLRAIKKGEPLAGNLRNGGWRATGGKQEALLGESGVYNYHKSLKALLNRACRMGRIDHNPYDRLKGQFKHGDKENVEYLTEDEMQRIRELDLRSEPTLDKARDLFVFQMFTGLAYSDAQSFDFTMYRLVDGSWRHTGERIKTGVPFVSQLLPPAVAVVEKYGGEVPHINNADYNHRLKVIGTLAHIKTRLHSHLARHSFATMMLSNGAKIENVSRMLGHTNITQTTRYAKVLAQSVHNDFEKVKGKWQ